MGIIPGNICAPGRVGMVSRSGTLTYEVVNHLTRAGIGQSTCVGIGGDPIIGTNFIDCLRAFQDDPETDAIVMIGEIGGTDEQNAAAFVREHVTKPVVGIHRRTDRPQGPPDGARRRHHLRLVGHGGGEAGGVRGRRDRHHAAAPRGHRAAAVAHVKLADLLSPRRVVVPLPAATLEEGMRVLMDACVADGRVSDALRLDQAVRESWPEDSMSLGPHAWLPHFRTDAVPALVVALGIAEAPIAGSGREADGREGTDPRMILMIVAPPRDNARYLQTVAAFARVLARPDVAEAMLAARQPPRSWRCRRCAKSSSRASCSCAT